MCHRTWMLACGISLITAVAMAADPQTVGELGDPDRIQFVGNTTFETRELRSALGASAAALLAAHPESPLDDLLPLLDRLIRSGYIHLGFAEIQVNTRYVQAQNAIVVKIVEGPRSFCGEIQIVGTKTVPIDDLRRLLTSKIPNVQASDGKDGKKSDSKDDPVWTVGKPASFAPGFWKSKHAAIQNAFKSLGYFDASFEVHVRPESNGKATLVISVADEGPQAILGEIEILGNQKNSAEDVIDLIKVPMGSLLNSTVKSRIEKQLASSARFLKSDVEIITPPFGNAPSILRIKLVEFPDAPRLTESFSDVEEVMVRMAEWVNTEGLSHDDLEVRLQLDSDPSQGEFAQKYTRLEARIVLSHRDRGCLFHFLIQEPAVPEPTALWVQLTPDLFSITASRQKLRFVAKSIMMSVTGTIAVTSKPPDEEGRMSNFQFGLGWKQDVKHKLPPFMLKTEMSPVAALREAKNYRDKWQLKDGLLSINEPTTRVMISADTGRLMRLHREADAHSQLDLVCEPDLYRKFCEEHDRHVEGMRIIQAGDVPISNFLAFIATLIPERLAKGDAATNEAFVSLLHTLLKRGAFHAFDAIFVEIFTQDEDEFHCTADADTALAGTSSWIPFVLPVVRQIVPNPSWPWTVCREFVFITTHQTPQAGRALQNLLDDPSTGPIANLTSAALFGMLAPQLKVEFSKRGLTRLRRARFQSDYEPFLREDSPVGRLLTATAQTLQELDDDEIASLVRQIPLEAVDERALIHALQQFPAHRSARPMEAIRAALDDAWEPLIEPRIRRQLEIMATERGP
jgi:hypothetical protein